MSRPTLKEQYEEQRRLRGSAAPAASPRMLEEEERRTKAAEREAARPGPTPPLLAPALAATEARLLAAGQEPARAEADHPSDSVRGAYDLFARLEALFGLGEDPEPRRRFYTWVTGLWLQWPTVVETCIGEARMQAHRSRQPGHYFVAALSRKLRERLTPGVACGGGTPAFEREGVRGGRS